MILRLTTLFALLTAVVSAEENPFDCKPTVGELSYDLTALNKEYSLTWEHKSSPTKNKESLRFNLCDDLKKKDEKEDDTDYCPAGTRACLTTTNQRTGDPDRIIHVVQIAKTDSLKPDLKASESPKGLNITLHGGSYSRTDSKLEVQQSLEVTLECPEEGEGSDPTFVSYDGSIVKLQWKHKAGCGLKEGEKPTPPKDDDGKKDDDNKKVDSSVGSGIGFFFLVVLLAFAAYFGMGAYYNYTTYGARGLDLIPHRDFWQEVPHMLRDIVSHLCSSFTGSRRPSSSRGGYIAV